MILIILFEKHVIAMEHWLTSNLNPGGQNLFFYNNWIIFHLLISQELLSIYKITKIVHALWLAERSVCMRVCKHGCDIRCFAFRALITQARIWKSFSDQNSTSLLIFPHSFISWNLENLFKQAVSTFFRLSWHFKWEKSVFWKAPFCKKRTDYTCKTSCTRLATVSNSLNPSPVYIRLCKHGKRFLLPWEYRPWKWHKDNRELSSASNLALLNVIWKNVDDRWVTPLWTKQIQAI